MSPHNDRNAVRIIPLGGLGEIGLNMMALECQDRILLVDCGLMFPDDDMLGVDIVIPDFSYLEGKADRIEALILTHAHEDHIGAVAYLLRRFQPPIVGSELTLAFLRSDLNGHKTNGALHTRVVQPRDRVAFGPFEVEFVRVTHSMAGGFALGITTPQGLIVHTGDFKMDFSPVDGEMTDLKTLAEFGERGVVLLMSDSTNVEREGFTISERDVVNEMESIFRRCRGRILVSAFASNILRIGQIFELARRFDRRVLLNGKSIIDSVNIASELGLLNIGPDQLLPLGELESTPKEQVVILCTGSQGEPLSVLARIASSDHKQISIERGDTVLLSAKTIPGNERAINNVINELYRQGADVIYETIRQIHTSGHAHREELKLMLKLTKPRHFIPVHGEYRHLVQHAQLARSMGVPENGVTVLETGDVFLISGQVGQLYGRVPSGRVYVDGHGVGDVGNIVLTDRRILSEGGTITCALAHRDGVVVSGPYFKSKGLVYEPDYKDLLEEARQVVLETLEGLRAESRLNPDDTKDEIARAVRRLFNKRIGRRPIVIPVIMEV